MNNTPGQIDNSIREFIHSFPGLIEAKSGEAVFRKAWQMCDMECDFQHFKSILRGYGYEPVPVRDKFRLRLPERPVTGPNAFKAPGRPRRVRDTPSGLR